MFLPKKKPKRPKMGIVKNDGRIVCPGHPRWVRTQFDCCARGRGPYQCEGRIDPHHVRTRGAGGGDEQVVPLCRRHHSLLDSVGWSQPKFEAVHGLNLAELAANLWLKSPHGIRWRREHDKEAA